MLQEITEGKTTVLVYLNKNTSKGPGVRTKYPFYNPSMELNRDISILVAQWLIDNRDKSLKLLDALASTGIRGFRFAKELEGDFKVVINDWSKEAYKLIKENLSRLNLDNVTILNEDIHLVLARERFHYIDIDPFGSPVFYIDSAIRSIHHRGIIAVTATDTATLCGLYPKVCLRRYSVRPYHSPVMHEIAIRILIGFIGREAAKYDKGIKPLLSYKTDHYIRLYLEVWNNTSKANETIDKISYISSSKLDFISKKPEETVGPLWLGKTGDKKIIKELIDIAMTKTFNNRHKLLSLLYLLEGEADAPAFYYTTNDIASHLKTSPPSLNILFEKLREKGYNVVRTHLDPMGFRTDAPREVIEWFFLQYHSKL
ncbi:MAG TPA: tRNA (guanine(10)-N(2))-dimethyltransferase [Thermoplasmatales archaeon]|nr:tRNA (guanine(10)-N(2))-dimethyltransferase [Thermoplasmatales archaeon]